MSRSLSKGTYDIQNAETEIVKKFDKKYLAKRWLKREHMADSKMASDSSKSSRHRYNISTIW